MNRIFGITGLLAAGTVTLWVFMLICLPWLRIYSSKADGPPISRWLIWGALIAIGLIVISLFVFRSLVAHWTALRHNTPIPLPAWRGVSGIYAFTTLALASPVIAGDPSGTHQGEMYLYVCLAALALILSSIAVARSFRNAKTQSPSP